MSTGSRSAPYRDGDEPEAPSSSWARRAWSVDDEDPLGGHQRSPSDAPLPRRAAGPLVPRPPAKLRHPGAQSRRPGIRRHAHERAPHPRGVRAVQRRRHPGLASGSARARESWKRGENQGPAEVVSAGRPITCTKQLTWVGASQIARVNWRVANLRLRRRSLDRHRVAVI